MRSLAFTGSAVDRDDHTRADPERLRQMHAAADARLLAMEGLLPVLDADNRLTMHQLSETDSETDLVYLGLLEGAPLFAPLTGTGDTRPGYQQRDARAMLPLMRGDELALYGQARALVDWHARHGFCANCGAGTHPAKGGWQRDCASCGASHFPRTDPVAIMLVEHDGRLLLGRGRDWPERSYSALAGFLEPGESIEEGVAREVWEEAGVRVSGASYIASQPWPFPSALMIGCHAQAESELLTIDETELEDARWFDRAEIAAAMDGKESAPFRTPPPFAIAHHLLKWWLEQAG